MFNAAIRQGWGEIGTLVKAFPDSISVEVMGGLANPTPQEIYQGKLEAPGLEATKGRELEMKFGPQRAGAMIYRASRPGKHAPHFFATNERAMADIKACAAEQLAAAEAKS